MTSLQLSFLHIDIVQAAAWSCAWDFNNAHNIYAGLQVWPLLFSTWLSLGRLCWHSTFPSCRMDHFWFLICVKLWGHWNPWMGHHVIQFILYTLLHVLVLQHSYPLLQLACVSGILLVVKKGGLVSCVLSMMFLLSFYLSPKPFGSYGFPKFVAFNWI